MNLSQPCWNILSQGRIESIGQEAMQLQCSVLKHQNSYEFIHDHKNSNNIQEFMGVYQIKWRHSLLECLLTKKLKTRRFRSVARKYMYVTLLLRTEWLLCKIGRSSLGPSPLYSSFMNGLGPKLREIRHD